MNTKKYYILSAVVCIYIGLETKNKVHNSSLVTLTSEKVIEKDKIQTIKNQEEETQVAEKQEPEKVTDTKTHTISIRNAVTKKMTCYRKFYQDHEPDTFAIRVDGKPLPQGEDITVSVTDKPIDVEYDFSFAGGLYKGTRKESFIVNPETDTSELTFNWNNEHRVSLAGAKVDTLS